MSENKHLTPVWIIYVDGRRLDVAHEGALRRITITDRLNGISSFSIVFDTTEVKVREEGLFSLESEISIHLGYKDDIAEVFSGEVLAFRAIFPETGAEQLEVSGCSVLHKLAHAVRIHDFEEKTVSDIIRGIVDAYSLQLEMEDFGASWAFSSRQGCTDYKYLADCAAMYGKNFYAAGNKIYIGDEITVRTDEIIYEWGKSLITFEASQNIRNVISDIDYIGWDPQKEESLVGTAGLSDLAVKVGGSNDWTGISNGGNGKFKELQMEMALVDGENAKQLALGKLQRNSYAFCRASGSGEGNYKLRPGMRVTVKMVGESFVGDYIADTVTHLFDPGGGYSTGFTLKRNMCP
jgi:phage protein D